MVYFRNVNEDIIIYKNTKYANLISKILEKKLELSTLAIYKLLSDKQSVIIRTIAQMAKGKLECYTKLLYHLCLAI
jgi:inorganic pyrophosphatase/exopolyphosphatase